MNRIVLLILFCSLMFRPMDMSSLDSHPANILQVLGKDRNSPELKNWKINYGLDRQFENNSAGVRLIINDMTGMAESIILNRVLSSSTVSAPELPFGLRWSDDSSAIFKKLGTADKRTSDNVLKWIKQNIIIEITGGMVGETWTMQSIRFFLDTEKLAFQSRVLEVKEEVMNKSREAETKKTPTPVTQPVTPELKTAKVDGRLSEFKKSILAVFKSYKETAFAALRTENRSLGNFWNYKHTYSTNIKIPGEKYNMLYSFPFSNSQLDFVSVLREGDALDENFIKTYRDFEKKLMENFTSKEGWAASCIANRESKTLSDLEFRHDHYGSVLMDYCKSPKGKHVLYLRFLPFAD